MKLTIPDFSSARLLVVGDLMLDRYWHGETSRISPEAPVPVVHVGKTEERPGGAGNVALNIVALGGQATLISLTGQDEAAGILRRRLQAEGIECHFDQLENYSTITKLRVISRQQQLIRCDFEDGFQEYVPQQLSALYRAQLAMADVVVLSDYGKGTLRCASELITAARAAGKPIVVDPKGLDFEKYRGATLITPNMTELEAVAGSCPNEDILVEKAESLRRHLELEALLITRSERGMTLLREHHAPLHLPTRAREVFDVTGAGDTVLSTLASALASGIDLAEATALANLAASVVVSKLGTATVNVQELKRALREQSEMERGLVDEDELLALMQEARSRGETVVMTNGCFDILHAGHVTYLQQARRLGDRLIVAVNDDASVKRLKGEERPVNTIERRMLVLAALDCVDWVLPFYEDTPTRLVCKLLPDILVKGGDNEPDKIPGGDCVRAAGGKVQVMGYVENCSTTGLIKMIRTRANK
ncbi:MAG: bifunctional D-glycero-beta-D-manno-heptose-7-phosphate kinase/D-glycero-beta-D-manno-heptose 1-phosphate adenylyltransferase HldE [Thiohalomonadaceae bacterium]